MYRLHNTPSEHSGVTNMYSLQTASNTGNTTLVGSGVDPAEVTPLRQQQQQQYQFGGYLENEFDNVRVVPSHNGGISHSYTLPHNLSHQHQPGGAGPPDGLHGSADHLAHAPPPPPNKAKGVVQQYLAQHGE